MKTKIQKHTPGPWEIVDHNEIEEGNHSLRTGLFVVGSDRAQIAEVLGERELAIPDARLIAAAPDQNAILCKIIERLDRWQRNGIEAGPKGQDSDFEELKTEARAALAKAEG